MLELGKAGSAGAEKGVLPVLRDGSVVAMLRASNWKEAATAVVGDREWVFAKNKGELTGAVGRRARGRRPAAGAAGVLLEGHLDGGPRGPAGRDGERLDVAGHPPVPQRGPAGRRERHDRRLVAPADARPATTRCPLHQQVFLLWLELVLSRRNTAAVGAATGAAVIGGSS